MRCGGNKSDLERLEVFSGKEQESRATVSGEVHNTEQPLVVGGCFRCPTTLSMG